MFDMWRACLEAKPMAEGFGGTFTEPSGRVKVLESKAISFTASFQALIYILNQEHMILAWADDFRQTFDECDDFLSDFQALQRGETFGKRLASLPDITYKRARYMYTDDEIAVLEQRIDLQLHVMHAKMDDIVLKHFMLVLARSSRRVDQDSASLGRTMSLRSSTQLESGAQEPDDELNIKYLYDRVKRLLYRLERTGPHVLSTAPAINQQDIRRVRLALKARFQSRELLGVVSSDPFALSVPAMDDEHFMKFSGHQLGKLQAGLKKQAPPTTRQRVYMSETLSFTLPEPAMALPYKENDAKLSIQNLGQNYSLQSIDIVTEANRQLLVSTDKSGSTGIIHHLPPGPDRYPITSHVAISPIFHEREVSMFEPCLVELVGSKACSVPNVIPLYIFPSLQDASSFQSSIRGKYLRHTFDTLSISSIRGEIASEQTIKLWTDFDDGQTFLSFYQHKSSPLGHRDFPLHWFEVDPYRIAGKDTTVRLKFHFVARRISRLSSWKGSFASLTRRASMTLRRSSGSFNTTVSPTGTFVLQPSPTGLTNFSPAVELDAGTLSSASSKDPSARDYMRDRAMSMTYLEIEFPTLEDFDLFKAEFRKAQGKKCLSISSPVISEQPESIFDFDFDLQTTTPALRGAGEVSDDLSPLERRHYSSGHDSPIDLGIFPQGTSNHIRAHHTKSPVISPTPQNQVFRVQGIPIEYSRAMLEGFLRSTMNIHPSITIEFRSLAISHDHNNQVAVFKPSSVPRCLSQSHIEREETWSFPYNTSPGRLESHDDGTASRPRNIQIDTHFRGLTMLYCPSNSVDHKIDICAVSGLGGHAYGSFKERGGGYVWLVDSIPYEFPHARVMTYGFNTKLESNTSNQDIGVLANYLLNSLEAMRTNSSFRGTNDNTNAPFNGFQDESSRPLLFIAHSLGGLVVKEAMMSAKTSKDHQVLLNSIHGALFFGVPSRGMDIEALRPMVRDQPNELLLHTLGPETDALRKQSMNFRKMFNKQRPEIMYFYECRESRTSRFDGTKYVMDGPLKLLVDKSSATDGGYYEEGAGNIYPLDKDHSQLVKFKQHDEIYPAVLNVLKKMVSTALLAVLEKENSTSAT